MPLVADRVAETTTTLGTGTVTLAGAKTGYRAFTSAFSTGAKVYYCITDNTNWEVGVGTFTTAGTTLSRDSVFASSNAGAAVNWGAGSKDVFCTAPTQTIVGAPILQGKTGAYTVVASDNGTIINCTANTFTVSLTAAATLGSGFTCWVWNTSGTSTHVITIDPNASETIDGASTLVLRRGEGCQIVCDGTNWQTGDKKTMRAYAENLGVSFSRPVASGDSAVAIGAGSSASAAYSAAIGIFTVASGSGSIAIGSGANSSPTASATEATALGARTTASSNYSTAIGINSGTGGSVATSNSGAMALGGSYASGTDSFAAAIANNTSSYGATGANAIAAGKTARAAGVSSVAFGELANASTNYALAFGYDCAASQVAAVAFGYQARSSIIGKYVYSVGSFGAAGDAQTGTFVLRAITLNATATDLTTNGGAVSSINQVVIPNNTAYAFSGIVIARQQAAGGTQSAAWKIEGLLRREGTAASTTLVASTVTAISNVPGWTLALSASASVLGALAITATGAAATNIRWVATVQTSEVTYA